MRAGSCEYSMFNVIVQANIIHIAVNTGEKRVMIELIPDSSYLIPAVIFILRACI